jgi:hypothetical protein
MYALQAGEYGTQLHFKPKVTHQPLFRRNTLTPSAGYDSVKFFLAHTMRCYLHWLGEACGL